MTRVLIAGAGICGLATGIALRNAGYDPVVFEQAEAFGFVGSGINLGATAVKSLRWLGAADEVREHGVRSTALAMLRLSDGRMLKRVELGERGSERYGEAYHSTHRADLLDGLLSQFPADHVRLGTRIVGVRESPEGVTVELADGERVEGDLLVGADGVHSVVRNEVFGRSDATFTNLVAWRSVAPLEAVPAIEQTQQVMTWVGDGRWVVMYPIGRGLVNVSVLLPAEDTASESWTASGDVRFLCRAFAGTDPGVLAALESIQNVLVTGIYARLPLRRWATDRTVLVGDAAHPMGPFLGSAAAAALEDAVTLGIVLERHGPQSIPAGLREFERRRVRRGARFVTRSLATGRALSDHHAGNAAARDGRVRGIARLDPNSKLDWEWLFGFDPIAEALKPVEALGADVVNPLRRPEARRAFEAWRDALADEHRAGSWIGEREGYEQFLTQATAPPPGLDVQERVLGGVAALEVRAEGATADRIALHLHGGGFVFGSAASSVELAGRMSAAWSCPVIVPDYRLAPEHPYPAAVDDVTAVYRALAAQGTPIFVSGECAGGALALALALRVRDEQTPDPSALLLASPFCDLSVSGASMDANAATEPWMTRLAATELAGSYIQDADLDDPLLSPLGADLTGLPPMLVAAAGDEGLRDDATRLVTKAQQAGVDARLELVDDSVHSFVLFPFLPESARLLQQARELVVKCVAR